MCILKDLPKVFANQINRNISNNKNISYGKLSEDRSGRNEEEVMAKINKLFKSDSTIYSIDCIIKFDNHEEKHTIIGKTNNNLVTKTQKLIPIKDIYDIDLA